MAKPVIMPRQGQSVESCILAEWFRKVGEPVKEGDLLFSYETDKAAFEAEATESGILLAVFANPGDEIPVLQNIAVIGKKGESFQEFLPEMAHAAKPEPNSIHDGPKTTVDIPPVEAIVSSGKRGISPRARKKADSLQISIDHILGTGPEGRIIERDIVVNIKGEPKATPLARSIAYEDKLRMPGLGSGARGKVLANDVKKAREEKSHIDFQDIKVSNIRKIIAANMQASLNQTAQLTLHRSADARKLRASRKKLKKEADEGKRLNITINDLVCFALIRALKRHPDLNAHFLETHIRQFNPVHLGFAVDTPRGLMVPTIRDAGNLSLDHLSGQMKELAAQAIAGKIDPELLKGASFTVTNLGAYGVEIFTPVLNPPQVAILGVNAITLQPVELDEGSIGIIPKIGLSLTFDHRAVDGAPAAAFLKAITEEIENIEIV